MTLTLDRIRAKILKATGTDIDDWDNGNADLDEYANISWWDIMDQFDFREKEADPVVFQTVMGQFLYDMQIIMGTTTFDALQRISIEDPYTFDHSDLDLITDYQYENEFQNLTTAQAKPTNYFRRAGKLYLFATPDQVYRITLYSLATLSDIPTQGPIIPQAWDESIIQGAVWRAFADLGDESKVRMWKALQADSINSRTPVKVKELADTKLAGVSIPGRDYP